MEKGLADFVGTLSRIQKDRGCSRDEAACFLSNLMFNAGVQEGRRQSSYFIPFLTGVATTALAAMWYNDYREEKKKKNKN